MKYHTLTFSDADLKKLEFCYFALNYVAGFENELEQMQGGLSAVVATGCAKMDEVYALFADAQAV